MVRNDLIGFGLFLAYFAVAGLPPVLLRLWHRTPLEITRKMYHLLIAFSIVPLVELFSAWYVAVLVVFVFLLMVYPVLALVEHASWYKRIVVERKGGEFKRTFFIVQLSLALVISMSWGVLGHDWQYVAVVAVMGWGFGDAAAALVGKAYGRRRVQHPRVGGAKTYEGTLAMTVAAGLAMFFTLLVYAPHSWQTSLAVATLVAPVSATVELFSPGGMDTLTVPLSAAFAIPPLMYLLSFAGV